MSRAWAQSLQVGLELRSSSRAQHRRSARAVRSPNFMIVPNMPRRLLYVTMKFQMTNITGWSSFFCNNNNPTVLEFIGKIQCYLLRIKIWKAQTPKLILKSTNHVARSKSGVWIQSLNGTHILFSLVGDMWPKFFNFLPFWWKVTWFSCF